MSKYSYSLDVGKDLDEELNVPKGLEKYEKEFKELVEDETPRGESQKMAKEAKKDIKHKKVAKKQAKDDRIKFTGNDGEILYYERFRGALYRVSA